MIANAICHHKGQIFTEQLLSRDEWKPVINWFVPEQSSEKIAGLTGIERKRVLHALLYVRKALILDVPDIFSGIAGADETYMGGQWKNKKKKERN